MSLNAINRSAELYNLFQSSVETNLTLDKIIQLLPLGSKLMADPSLIRRYAIGPAQTYNYIVPGSGAMVLIPDAQAVREIIIQALYQ
jgi:hypothetical protein